MQFDTGSKHHLREKNIVYPTERSENAAAFSKLAEKDIRFSMKMMLAAGLRNTVTARLNCHFHWLFCSDILR
jgi:hypothetical protein